MVLSLPLPFASDLEDLGQLNISFELGSPFKPFNQLLGVFPARSSHGLPLPYRKLMTDPNSSISDFYPSDFEVDMNGKRYSWQGIAKLPFIDESHLLAEVKNIEHLLTEEEARRNCASLEMLFVVSSHSLSQSIYLLDNRCKQLTDQERVQTKELIDPELSDGMNGYISPCPGDTHPPIFRSPVSEMEDILDNEVICAIYRLPDPHKHITQPPPVVIFTKRMVDAGDLKGETVLWHEDTGRRPWENNRCNQPGNVSGHQLGDASCRLVVNSLQYKGDRNGHGGHMHAQSHQMSAYGPPAYHSSGMHPRTEFSQTNHQRIVNSAGPPYHDSGYPNDQPYVPPDARSVYSQQPRYARDHQRHAYPYQPVSEMSNNAAAYSSYQGYDSCHPEPGSRFTPLASHNIPAGPAHQQARGNQFTALDRNNRMPPHNGGPCGSQPPPPGLNRSAHQAHPGGANTRVQQFPTGGDGRRDHPPPTGR